MPYLLRLRADATIAAIQMALGRIRPRDVALVFPPGIPIALTSDADFAGLLTLHRFCEALDKEVVIIGGDAALRAAAVASGFASATSLDAWKGASGSRLRRPTSAPMGAEDEWSAPLSLIGDDPDQEADFDVLPEYVQQLLENAEEYRVPHDHDPSLEARIARTTRPLDDDEDDIAGIASESYEDGFTAIIRGTGGLEEWPDALGSRTDEEESSDSSTM